MFGVKINGEFLENPIDGEITFELNFGGFEDSLIPGSLTYPNDFPVCEVNDRLLQNGKLIDSASKIVYYEGEVYLFNNFYDRCKVVRLNTSRKSYRLSVIINGISIDLKGKTLRDIDTSSEIVQFSDLSEMSLYMRQCNDNILDRLFFFPRLINSGAFPAEFEEASPYIDNYFDGVVNRYLDTGTITPFAAVGYIDQHFPRYFISPTFREVKLLELLFAQYGYKLTGSFINDPLQRDLLMYSNRLLKADLKGLIQVSIPAFNDDVYADGYYFPVLKSGPNPMDQDYNNLLGVWIDNDLDLQYPHDLPKIKLDTSKSYRVSFRGMYTLSAINVQTYYLFVLPSTEGLNAGDIGFQIPITVPVTPDTATFIEHTMLIDFSDGSFGATPPDELYLVMAFKPGFGATDILVENFCLQVNDFVNEEIASEPLDASVFLPKRSIEEWLIGLKKQFNLNFAYNPFSRTVSVDYLFDKLTAPAESIDTRIGDDYPIQTSDQIQGYTLKYEVSNLTDSLIDNNFSSLDSSLFVGFEPPVNPTLGQYYIDPATARVMKWIGSRWAIGPDYYYPSIVGNGNTEITINGRAPLMMRFDADDFALQPAISTPMHFPRYGQSNDDFDNIRVAYFRGYQADLDNTTEIPTASTMITHPDGVTVYNGYEMWFVKNRDQSLFQKFHKRWMSFRMHTERLRDKIMIDLPFIQRLFETQKRIRNTVFLAGKLIFTVKNGSIREAEIELYRNNYENE